MKILLFLILGILALMLLWKNQCNSYEFYLNKSKIHLREEEYDKFIESMGHLLELSPINRKKPFGVIKNLYIGNIMANYKGFDVIINASGFKLQQPNGEYHDEKVLYDNTTDNIKDATEYYKDIITKALKNNKKVLVHCYAGKSRSFTIIARFLLDYYSLEEILDLFDNWYIAPNPHYIKFLIINKDARFHKK
jgi:hypothetical protein